MKIFGRMKEIAAADIHHMLDRYEDPISMAKQYIRQLEEQIEKIHHALAEQYAAERQNGALITRTEAIVSKRARQARLAVDRQEDNIAELALQEKLYHQQMLNTYVEQQALIREQASALKEEQARLAEAHRELQNKLSFLISRAHAAQAIEAAAAAMPPFQRDKIMRGFARMEEKVWILESKANAARNVQQSAYGTPHSLDVQEEVQAELQKLKEERKAIS
ncbi:PspA/IM30 family protein [Paenibacillus oenotherae]|uniref:PspA/IM30 family protein n=1 Tax=Paenibacillus oenotherae TaxID=1435645 RepID=A0ABS7DAV4_9BACL|nr:PspA/IM30 family protein [Paenibacillus oenotherae]MBW7477059.1 PspA/IM30 family protein [Paenibacillus oenotherae]